MLRVYINNSEAEISDNISIPLKLKNPLFNHIGSHSLSFSLPNSIVNAKIFGYPYNIARSLNLDKDYTVRLEFDGINFFSGLLKVTNVFKKEIKCHIYADTGSLKYQMQDNVLKDISTGGDRNLGATASDVADYYKDVAYGSQDDYDFAIFPVYNDAFYNDSTMESRWNNRKIMNHWYNSPTYGLGFFEDNQCHVPFPYLGYIIERILNDAGFSVDSNILKTDSDMKQLCVFNTYAQEQKDWMPAPISAYDYRAKRIIDLSNNLPDIDVITFIEDLKSYLSIVVFPNSNNTADIKTFNQILEDINYDSIDDIVENIEEISEEYISGFSLKATNDSADEFYSDNVHSIDNYNRKNDVVFIGDLPASGNSDNDLRLCTFDNKFFAWQADPFDPPDRWIEVGYNLLDYIYGDGSYDISSSTDTLLMHRGTDPWMGQAFHDWLTPRCSQKGNQPVLRNFQGNLCASRLLFYRGIDQNSEGEDYPLGTNHIYNYQGNKISTANLSLRSDTEYGRYEKLFKKWFYYKQNIFRNAIADINWDIHRLKNLRMYRKLRYKDNNFLINSIDVNIEKYKIRQRQTELVKV